MKPTCKKCGDHELVITSNNIFFHEVETLSSLVKIEVDYLCPGCGQKTGQERVIAKNEANRINLQNSSSTPAGEVKRHLARLSDYSSRGRGFTSLDYPSVYRDGENVLYPMFEGNVQDGTLIDRHGNPDLMLEFAEQYFRLFCSIMPTERLPNSLIELMPALHLLVVATELALKAYLIRNDKTDFGHSLGQLYGNLDFAHRNEIEARFAKCSPNANLATMDIDPPSVEAILSTYDTTYGESKVYMDTRYLAEPTTTFKPSSNLHGANLIKSNNPYPIFLPEIVAILFDTYRLYSGHERLGRLGGDVRYKIREPIKGNHGDWGLVPSSLGLVVLSVPQSAGVSAKGANLDAFNKLVSDNPPAYKTNWMYGGATLLFYAEGQNDYVDGRGMLNGVECRVWRRKRLGMHARDLNFLATVLEGSEGFTCLSGVPSIIDE